MNLGGSFSLKVSRSGVEEIFWLLTKLFFSPLEGCLLSLVHCRVLQYPGCYSRG